MEVGIDGCYKYVQGSEHDAYCNKLVEALEGQEGIHIHTFNWNSPTYQQPSYIHLYHCMNNGFTLRASTAKYKIATIHTMLPYSAPQLCSNAYKQQFFDTMTYHKTHHTPLITTCCALRDEVSNYLERDRETIGIIQMPQTADYRPTQFALGGLWIRDKLKIEGPYMLYIGDCHQRKQLIETLSFFQAIKHRTPELKLVMICPKVTVQKTYMQRVRRAIVEKRLERAVYLFWGIEAYDKRYLYQEAACVLDFGIDNSLNPYLVEAIGCGCPIVCSDTAIHHEILGKQGLYIDDETFQYGITSQDFGIGLPQLERKAIAPDIPMEGGMALNELYSQLFEKER